MKKVLSIFGVVIFVLFCLWLAFNITKVTHLYFNDYSKVSTIQGLSMAENSNRGFNYFYTEITIDSVFNDTVNVYYTKSLIQTSGANKFYQFASSNVDTMHLCIEGDSTAAGQIGDTDSLCIRLFALAPDSGLVLDSLDLVTDLDWDVEKVYTYKFPVYRQGAGYRAMIWRHCGAEDCIFKIWFQK